MTLDRLAAAWRRRWWMAAALVALASGALSAAAGRSLLLGSAVTLIVIVGCWLRRPRMDARTAARHLNRAWPELQESAELLVVRDDALSAVERLQRDRTRRALERIATPTLPHRA